MGLEEQDKPTYEELEDRLHKMEKFFEQSERLSVSNQYAAAVMHEVNNPLEAITNLVYLAEQEQISAAAMTLLESVQEQLAVLTAVSRASLSFYRDQAKAKEIDLVRVAESALKLHFQRLTRHNVRVLKRFSESAVCSVVASEILQVLSNLILNSIDAIPDGSTGTLHVRVSHRRDATHLTIADNGAGIPERVAKLLFQPHVTGKQTGSGLGLWLSHRLVQKHHGTMRCRTSRALGNSGTIFRISLPHSAPESKAA